MNEQLKILDVSFGRLHRRSVDLVNSCPEDEIFVKPQGFEENFQISSFGEYILRSAGAVEQSFGGLTARLWDDPFEWTLPEELSGREKILSYFEEVEQTRGIAFQIFKSDEDLKKELPAPEKITSIFEILIRTLVRSQHFQGKAEVILELLVKKKNTLDQLISG